MNNLLKKLTTAAVIVGCLVLPNAAWSQIENGYAEPQGDINTSSMFGTNPPEPPGVTMGGDHIYYGKYDHLRAFWTNSNHQHDGVEKPILWRMMGEEKNNSLVGDKHLTVMSEYVLDAAFPRYPAAVKPSIDNPPLRYDADWWRDNYATAQLWYNSYWDSTTINIFLNKHLITANDNRCSLTDVGTGTSSKSFSDLAFSTKEFSAIDAPTQFYQNGMTNPAYPVGATVSHIELISNSPKIWIPAIGPNGKASTPDANLFITWYADLSTTSVPEIDGTVVNSGYLASLRGLTSSVCYYTRTAGLTEIWGSLWGRPQYFPPNIEYMYGYLMVNYSINGGNSISDNGVEFGLRPLFKLNSERVLFMSKITAISPEIWETQADGDAYKEGTSGTTNYKLTVIDEDNIQLTSLQYNSTEISAGGGTLLASPGGTFTLAGAGTGFDKLVYKIVRTADQVVVGYGVGNAASLIVSTTDNMLTNSPLDAGAYALVVWGQKDETLNSHRGSEPVYLLLSCSVPSQPTNLQTILGDGMATLTWSAPQLDGGSAVTGYEVSKDGVHWTSVGAGTSYTFSGLVGGVAQRLYVRAVNVNGAGAIAIMSVTPRSNGAWLAVPEAQKIDKLDGKYKITIAPFASPLSNGQEVEYAITFTSAAPADSDWQASNVFTDIAPTNPDGYVWLWARTAENTTHFAGQAFYHGVQCYCNCP